MTQTETHITGQAFC